MKKNLFVLVLTLAITFSLAGCGDVSDSHHDKNKSDQDLINDLLDRYESAIEDKNTEKMDSVCTFPFKYEGDEYSENQVNAFLGVEFAMVTDFNLDNRIITINGEKATIDSKLNETKIDGDHDSNVEIICIKINGTWKVSSFETL